MTDRDKPGREEPVSPDDRIALMVKNALDTEPALLSYQLSADVIDGVVTLRGVVDVLAEKNHAQTVAQGVDGIRRVHNGITMSTDGAINDDDVTFEVMEELEEDPDIDLTEMGAVVMGGTVFLKGFVESPEYEQYAIDVASRARGVIRVISELEVGTGGADDVGVRHVRLPHEEQGFGLHDWER